MSVRGLIEVAAERDQGVPMRLETAVEPPPTPEEAVRAGGVPPPPALPVTPQGKKAEPQGYLDLLVTAIPTEPLALYTFLIAGIVTTIEPGSDQRLTMRWIIFSVTVAFIAIWMAAAHMRTQSDEKQKRKLPVVEILCAVFAFSAWGLVMPESPLTAQLSGADQTVWTFIITAAGAALVGLFTGSMKKPAKAGS
jgi:hypothetical protein